MAKKKVYAVTKTDSDTGKHRLCRVHIYPDFQNGDGISQTPCVHIQMQGNLYEEGALDALSEPRKYYAATFEGMPVFEWWRGGAGQVAFAARLVKALHKEVKRLGLDLACDLNILTIALRGMGYKEGWVDKDSLSVHI